MKAKNPSPLLLLSEIDDTNLLLGSFFLALDFEKGKDSHWFQSTARLQRAEGFTNCTVLATSPNRNQRTGGMIAKGLRKGDLFLGGEARDIQIRRAEMADQLMRKRFDYVVTAGLLNINNLRQRGPPKGRDAEEAAAERRARLSFKLRGILIPEYESPRNCPLSRLGGAFKNKCVRGVEPDRAQQFHKRISPESGSNQEGSASALRSLLFEMSEEPLL